MYLKLLLFTKLILISSAIQAAQESTQTFSLDGRAYSNSNATTPLLDNNVQFKVQILNDAQDCILYEETQNKNTNTTNGYFVLQVGGATGAGKRSSGDSNNAMASVYSNTVTSINGKLVSDGTTVCTYNPVSGHMRYVRVVMTPSIDSVARVLSPLVPLDSVPSAIVAERAETLQGILPNQFLQVNTTTSSLSQANLESLLGATSFSRLTTLASVDPSTYVKANSNGSVGMPVVSGDPTGLSNGQVWFDSVSGQLKYYDGAVKNVGSGTASFPLLAPDGAVANPSYSFSNSNGTGLSFNFGMLLFNVASTNVFGLTSSSFQFNQSGSAATPVINWGLDSADTNTGIFHPAADTIALSTNGTERFRVNASGDVGIGTNNPAGILDVRGGTAAASTAGTHINIVAQNGGAGGGVGGSIYLKPGTGSAGQPSGTVNIGATVGAPALSINRDDATVYASSSGSNPYPSDAMNILNTYSIDDTSALVRYAVRNGNSRGQEAYLGAVAVTGAGVYTPAFVFGQKSGANSYQERFRIDHNGNFGIGTTTPSGPFHVVGGSNSTGAGLPITITGQASTASGDNNGGDINISGGARSGNGLNGRINLQSTTGVTGTLTIAEGSGTPGYTGASSSARVPTSALAVGQNFNQDTTSISLRTRNSTTTDQYAYIAAVPNNGISSPSIAIGQQTGANSYQERLRIDQNGNMGLGTTSPTVPFEVTRSIPGTITSAGTTVTGTGTSFLSTFIVGDAIYANMQVRTITAIASDTSLTTDTAFSPVLAGISYTRAQAKINGTIILEANGQSATSGTNLGQELLILRNTYTPHNYQTGSAIKFEGESGKSLARIGAVWNGGADLADILFQTVPGREMIFGQNGSLGIGNSVYPTSKLHVVRNDAVTTANVGVTLNNTSTSSTASINKTGVEIQSTGTWNGASAINTGLAVTVSGGSTNVAATFSGGNVGIGWDDPDARLHVRASGISGLAPGTDIIGHFEGGGIQISTANSTYGVIRFGDDSTNATNNQPGYIMYDHTNDSMSFKVNSSERFRVDSSGRMGIGDTSPDTTLKVNGSLCVKSDDNNCAGAVAGTIYANNTTVQSADYAEYFLSEGYLDKGEIVGLNSKNGLARKYQVGDKLLGVVSTSPGVVGNSDIKDKVSVLVALMGQVPFKKDRVKIKENLVSTIDGQPIGYLLASGHVYVNISSNSDLKETRNKIQKLEAENTEMRKRLERLERAIAQEN